MSFERFSSSDIYMYEHVGGFIECCGCWFVDWDSEEFPHLATPREALVHLDRHENAGHDIGNARNRILKEYPDLDIEIEPWSPPNPEFDMYMQEYERIKYLATQHPPQQFRDRSNGE
jgi:hypothetical protein